MHEAEELPLSQELLQYYRARLREAEADLQQSFSRLDQCAADSSEMQQLREDARKRDNEISELQKALRDATQRVFEAQQDLLKVRAENDSLRVQEMEDRRRIQHLLALTNPGTQDVTYFRQVGPEKVAVGKAERAAQPSTTDPMRVLRTVYLPSEKTDTLLMTIQAQRAQMEEQVKLAAERIATLTREKEQRDDQDRVRHIAANSEKERMANSLADTEKRLQQMTHDYVNLRGEAQHFQRRMKEDNEALLLQNKQLFAALERQRFRSVHEQRAISMDAARLVEESGDNIRKQLQKTRLELARVQTELADLKASTADHQNKLVDELRKTKGKLRESEVKRSQEAEGCASDVNILREKLRSTERIVFKLLPDVPR